MAKKTEQILVRITEELMNEVIAVQGSSGIKGTEMARIGLVEVLQRMKAKAPAVRPEIAALIARAEEHGIDLVQVLEEAMAKFPQPLEAKAS